jgi:hypothetical protein
MDATVFADDSKFEAVDLAEDELIDAYVRNELSPEEQRQFKAMLLSSPRIRDRVNFAQALAERADSFLSPEAAGSIEPDLSSSSAAAKPKAPWWKGLFAQQPALGMATGACALLILVAGFVLVSSWSNRRSESARLAAEMAESQHQKEESDKRSAEQRTRIEQLNAEAQRERDRLAQEQKRIEDQKRAQNHKEPDQRSTLGSVAYLFLTPGGSRSSGEGHDLPIGPEASTVQLELALERNDYRSYNVTIENADGKVVVPRNGLKAHNRGSAKVLTITVPVRLLPPDNYIITVKGVTKAGTSEDAAYYSFRVLKPK